MTELIDFIDQFAKSKNFEIKPHTIFVEGITDVEIFRLAAEFEKKRNGIDLLGEKLAIVAAGEADDGGAKGVCRELVSFKNMSNYYLLPNGHRKYRFIGLFDNDRAGRQAINEIRGTDTSVLEFKDVFRLWPIMPLSKSNDIDSLRREFESENKNYKNLDWELEDLIPNSFSEIIVDQNPFLLRKAITINNKIHREWTKDGKAQVLRFFRQNAIYSDFESVIHILRAFWHYLNIK